MAILQKENSRREQEKQRPLEIVFYYQWGSPSIVRLNRLAGGKYMKFKSDWVKHPLHNKKRDSTRNKENIYIHFLDGNLCDNEC